MRTLCVNLVRDRNFTFVPTRGVCDVLISILDFCDRFCMGVGSRVNSGFTRYVEFPFAPIAVFLCR